MDKKAQQSRNDIAILYSVCLIVVFLAVGTMYSLGIIGEGIEHGTLVTETITAATVTDSEETKDNPFVIENTENNNTAMNKTE